MLAPARAGLGVGLALLALALGVSSAFATLLAAPELRGWGFSLLPGASHNLQPRGDQKGWGKQVAQLEKRIATLDDKLKKMVPQDSYIIIDTPGNQYHLMVGGDQIREGNCSTGSYILLKAGDDRQWIFATPRGMYKVLNKLENPIWRKPDWAFIEEGKPVPPQNSPERFESGVLGDYALYFGNGYMLHGTLYKRLLGMPVTHGCVRLDDDSLEAIFKSLKIGSRVFIY
jgi:L,D-transpeptidase ErfK/SrfK